MTDVHKSPEQVEREAAIIAKKWDRPTKKSPTGATSKVDAADDDNDSAVNDASVDDGDSSEQCNDKEETLSGGCDDGNVDVNGDTGGAAED